MGDDDTIARFGDVSNGAIGMRMRALRQVANAGRPMSQPAFGDAIGAKKPSVQAWENGRQQPQVEHLQAACRLYAVTTDFILLGDWRRLPAGQWAVIRAAILAGDGTPGEAPAA